MISDEPPGKGMLPVRDMSGGSARRIKRPRRIPHIMRPIDPWLATVGFALLVLCLATVAFMTAGPDAARIIVLAVAALLYALAALVRALGGFGGHRR
jgi:hypothetical protein